MGIGHERNEGNKLHLRPGLCLVINVKKGNYGIQMKINIQISTNPSTLRQSCGFIWDAVLFAQHVFSIFSLSWHGCSGFQPQFLFAGNLVGSRELSGGRSFVDHGSETSKAGLVSTTATARLGGISACVLGEKSRGIRV
jgi:hypothetical protein